jgi:hypothetical protein
MPKKFDGVIEAVRYAPDGKIALVRAYERRGAIFSDCVLINRAALVERLKKGEKFVTGQRQEFMASTFAIGAAVSLAGEAVTTSSSAGHDALENVPLF